MNEFTTMWMTVHFDPVTGMLRQICDYRKRVDCLQAITEAAAEGVTLRAMETTVREPDHALLSAVEAIGQEHSV
ncbi:hypothetical protein BH09PSE5_BH09PSE5_06890 [soil metagenome]